MGGEADVEEMAENLMDDQNEQNTQTERAGAGSSAVREKDIPTMCMGDLWAGVELLPRYNREHHGPP